MPRFSRYGPFNVWSCVKVLKVWPFQCVVLCQGSQGMALSMCDLVPRFSRYGPFNVWSCVKVLKVWPLQSGLVSRFSRYGPFNVVLCQGTQGMTPSMWSCVKVLKV